MSNDNKSLMSPDRVLSLVVMLISAFMIVGGVYLYRAQVEYYDSGASIQKATDYMVGEIQLKRQANQAQVNE